MSIRRQFTILCFHLILLFFSFNMKTITEPTHELAASLKLNFLNFFSGFLVLHHVLFKCSDNDKITFVFESFYGN